ncbi:MAG TPA: hypothetical protein VJ551_04485 [Nitrososphaeraceae archaeon]|nr:hypothetical protein [Nitrososphaeraceae archaeon]HJU94674.1 hypothetical protein [Nitrososphaera sp.]
MNCNNCNINYKRLAITISIIAPTNMLLLFGLFMNPVSQEIIFSDSMGQSSKLVAVWTQVEPVPSLVSLIPALIIMPSVATLVFARFYDLLPMGDRSLKGLSFGIMLWALVAVFFELFTPYGLFGEPLILMAYELTLWLVGLSTIGTLMGILYGRKEKAVAEVEQLEDMAKHYEQ